MSPECQVHDRTDQIFYLPLPFDETGRNGNLCLQCGSHRYLQKVEIIHLLVHDPDGKIAGSQWGRFRGTNSNFYMPACERGQRAVKEGKRLKNMTALPEAATCHGCLERLEGMKAVGYAESGLWIPAARDEVIE